MGLRNCPSASEIKSQQALAGSTIKSILVPVSGSETDRVVLSSAWALAEPLQAHLEFLHLRLNVEEAAGRYPHVEFCKGPTLRDALSDLAREHANLSTSAANYARNFCLEHSIAFDVKPCATGESSAECLEEVGPAVGTLLFHARHRDLTVVGRAQHVDCLPKTWIEELLMNSGHPLLIVPKCPRWPLLGTVLVGWKESAASAHALAAALPLLQFAQRVVVINVAEGDVSGLEALSSVRELLAWHGIKAEVQCMGDGLAGADKLLTEAAVEMKAGLLVIGGFGHSRLRETILGGVTHSLLNNADVPLFIAH